jgi:hypothetical protein
VGKQADEKELQLRIVVLQPPPGVVFAVQEGRSALLPPAEVHKDKIAFQFSVRAVKESPGDPPNFLGPFAQGPRGGRFVYVNSGRHAGQKDTLWDRRAKVPLGGIAWSLVEAALAKRAAVEARVDGVGRDGGPACGSVRLVDTWRLTPPGLED